MPTLNGESVTDAELQMRHREQAIEYVVSLVNHSPEQVFTAAELVTYADAIALYLDYAVLPADVHGNPVESP